MITAMLLGRPVFHFTRKLSPTVARLMNSHLCSCARNMHSQTNNLETQPSCDMLNEEEGLMQEAARRFARDRIAPLVSEMDRECRMNPDLIKDLFKNGFMSIEGPEEFGGSGSTFFSSILVIEEFARVDPSIAVLVDIQNTLIVTLIDRLGNKEQREYWLPLLAHGTVGSFALSEPESGSDAFALKTVARPDGDDFIINGSKCWISNSGEAGVFLLMANANPSEKHRGITTFIIPRDTPGFTIGRAEDKLGLCSSSTCTLTLEDVRLPRSAVLGEVGQGYRYAIGVLNEGRIGIAAQMLGLAQGCHDHTLAYVKERKQFGQAVWRFQAVQHQIAQQAVLLEAARTMTYNIARRKQCGHPITKQAAMVKYYTSTMAGQITSNCVELMGGVGFTKSYPVEKYYRDVKIGTIYEGTSNIQLNTIAKCIDMEQ